MNANFQISMSFGFSASDFIAAGKLIKDIISVLHHDAASSYFELILELHGLKFQYDLSASLVYHLVYITVMCPALHFSLNKSIITVQPSTLSTVRGTLHFLEQDVCGRYESFDEGCGDGLVRS